ncbi:hypothetical protein B0F90DRAFT_713962 [Multifurca ochricompacta]|uniref:USP8 dimerisation domain-containing protein n=1 Tax=Multifurca ochricompacta TaxID=376703 RepID=A0AAD4QJN5_9AGAM|nr:hypothetical protein B0F90DRAFT_713962 [Multifurca ochricompacta]
MSSSYTTDAYTQSSQFRPATFNPQVQPAPSRIYQNLAATSSNIAQTHVSPPSSQTQGPSRPHSIAELAELAKQSFGDDTRPFKAWLRIAENARRDAKSFQEQGDIESAFVEFAKAATIVLEKIPSHPDYRVLLSSTQRHNMGLMNLRSSSISLVKSSSSLTAFAVPLHGHLLYTAWHGQYSGLVPL